MSRNLKNIARLISSVNEELPIEKQFLNDLERSIELNDKNNARVPSASYKPSSMNCIRQMWYMRKGVQPEVSQASYALVGICNSGTDIHQRIQQAVLDMKKVGIECEYMNVADFVKSRNLDYLEIVKEPDFEACDYETKLYHKTLYMSFLCDGIIKYKNQYYILELKTENSNKFWSRNDVDPKHYNQATAYSIAFGINDVLFVYISRDTLDMKAFMYKVSEHQKNELSALLVTCEDYVIKNELPEKPESTTACRYCNYKNLCSKNIF